MTRLNLEQRDGWWWVVDREPAPKGLDDHGPYATRKEADEDRRGLERFLKSNPNIRTNP